MDQQPPIQNYEQCPACGEAIPAGSLRCPNCGAEQVEPAPLDPEAQRERAFLLALYTRPNPFTYLFIGMNAGVLALMWMAGGMGSMSADPDVLVAFGAKVNDLIRTNGEYWRFVTSMFIHIGFLHLLLNSYALYVVGPEIERLYGSSRFVILYLATGICGSFASYLYTDVPSAGASGAIFGLFGVLAAFAFRYRGEAPREVLSSIKKQVIPLILLNLVIGFSVRQVDNAAHIGGLISGIALGLVIPYKRPQEKASALVWRAGLVVSLAIIAGSIFIALRNYDGPPLSLAGFAMNPDAKRAAYVQGMTDGYNSLVESTRAFQDAIERRGSTASSREARDAAERGLRFVNDTPNPPGRASEFRSKLLALLEDQQSLTDRYAQGRPVDWNRAGSEQEALIIRARQFLEEFQSGRGED